MQQDRVVQYGQWLIKRRWPVLFGMLLIAVAAMAGVMHMQLKNEYRVFFGEDNPQLQAFDKLEKIYTKNDNVLLVIAPKDGNVFSSETLSVVENLTHEAWQIPYAIRVDGVTNFQHTRAEEDDLILVDSPGTNPFNSVEIQDLKRFLEVDGIEPVLVIAAGGDVNESSDMAAAWRPLGVRRVIFTRLDATRRYGAIIAAADATGFILGDVSLSPYVAEGLKVLNPVTMARLLLRQETLTSTLSDSEEKAAQ